MILPMKKALIVCMADEKEALVEALQAFGGFMPMQRDAQSGEAAQARAKFSRAQSVYEKSAPFRKKRSMFAGRAQTRFDALFTDNPDADGALTQTEALLAQLDELDARQEALNRRLALLAPWRQLEVPVESLAVNAYTAYLTGFARENVLPRLVEALGDDVVICTVGQTGDRAALVCVCAREDMQHTSAALRAGGFEPENIPLQSGMVQDACVKVENELADCRTQRESVTQRLRQLCSEDDAIKVLLESRLADVARSDVAVSHTARTVYLTGWVPAERAQALCACVQQAAPGAATVLEDPQESDTPPTLAKNNRFVSPFETITDMFSRPAYNSLDPNPVMSLWYWLIFGMMMADAGYGLLLLVLGYGFKRLVRPRGEAAKLTDVLLFGSASTMIFGVLFGSYFGETFHPILFSPLDDPMRMLIFSLIVGVLHLFTGLVLDMVQKTRAGRFWDGIFDDLSWMLLITGLGCLFLEPVSFLGAPLAVLGAAVILCTAGREKKGIFGKITGGLGGLYNVTGYMSDILSYSRILALGMATGVIGMVMNLLAGLVQGSVLGFVCSLLIYAAGHLFNLAMGLLSAYVHDSRLQYIEFFGKFYEGGGEEFAPLTFAQRYVDVAGNDNK